MMTDIKNASPSRLPVSANKDSALSLGEFFSTLWGGRYILLCCLLVGLLLGLFNAKRATPLYQSEGVLQVETRRARAGNPSLMAVTEGVYEVNTGIPTAVEMLKSSGLIARTVEELQLDVEALPASAHQNGLLGKAQAPAGLIVLDRFDVQADGKSFLLEVTGEDSYLLNGPDGALIANGRAGEELRGAWSGQPLILKVREIKAPSGQRFALQKEAMPQAVERVRELLVVQPKGLDTNLISLSYRHPDPALAAKIVNSLMENFIWQSIERKTEETGRTLAFIQEQMPLLKRKLETSEERLNQYRIANGAVDLSEEARQIFAQSTGLETQLVALQQKKSEMLRTFQSDSEVVLTLDKQIADIHSRRQRLDQSLRSLPQKQQEVLRFTRDVQVNQDLFTSMTNNVQQLQIAKAGDLGNARIVDPAVPSPVPLKSMASRIVIVAAMAGFLLGVGLVMLRNALKGKGLATPDALEASTGLNVLATVPHHSKGKGTRKAGPNAAVLLSSGSPDCQVLESLRRLRTILCFMMQDAPCKPLMMVGPSPQSGSSFILAHLALVLVQRGSRVLLVDADLRRGMIHEYFKGLNREMGLSEILNGQTPWQKAVKCVNGVNVITTGTLSAAPADLLAGPLLGEFLKEACLNFDCVLIDVPPIMAVSDALIVGSHAGTVLLNLRSGKHTQEEILAALKSLENAGISANGCVFNDMPKELELRHGSHRYPYERLSPS